MTKFIVPRKLWLAFVWGAAFARLLAFRYERDYRDRLNQLPALVDVHGHTASLETAMSGLESYEQAKQIRKYGFVSLGVALILCVCAGVSKQKNQDKPT